MRFAEAKVNDRSEGKAKTRTKNVLMYASLFLLTTDRHVEKGVEDGVHTYLRFPGRV